MVFFVTSLVLYSVVLSPYESNYLFSCNVRTCAITRQLILTLCAMICACLLCCYEYCQILSDLVVP